MVIENNDNYVLTPIEGLAHEAGHAWQDIYQNEVFEAARKEKDSDYGSAEERRNITKIEYKIAKGLGRLGSRTMTRSDHNGGIYWHVDIGTGKTKNLLSEKKIKIHM